MAFPNPKKIRVTISNLRTIYLWNSLLAPRVSMTDKGFLGLAKR